MQRDNEIEVDAAQLVHAVAAVHEADEGVLEFLQHKVFSFAALGGCFFHQALYA